MTRMLTYGEILDRIDVFDLAYPDRWFVVEVTYKNGGDVAIAEVRAERNKPPKERDNAYGFTLNFRDYEKARAAGIKIAQELGIKACL